MFWFSISSGLSCALEDEATEADELAQPAEMPIRPIKLLQPQPRLKLRQVSAPRHRRAEPSHRAERAQRRESRQAGGRLPRAGVARQRGELSQRPQIEHIAGTHCIIDKG